ncbi:hypothetical protein ACIQ9E_18290 [Streptomyces sp. NPDC094448]|uniref:hypothetical protein n=1 Tax=Streptomyces sp. NPDC094448 TaxID=3366063 RepID=UPI003824FF1B
MAITARITSKILQQYGDEADAVASLLEEVELEVFHRPAEERFTAAVLILADGSVGKLLDALRLMEMDWRDLLIAADVAQADWSSVLNDFFGVDS